MNSISRFLLVALVATATTTRVSAQVAVTQRPSGRTLSLDEALRRSLQHNPEIAKVDAALADKLAGAIGAEVKLNPTFKVAGERVSAPEGGVGGDFILELEQPLRPSDFGLRKTYASALRVAANLEQQADVLRVLNATAILFYRAWALQQRGALLTRARTQADDALGTIQEQLEAGQSNVSQRSVLEAELARFSVDLLAVRGEQAGIAAELERAIGTRSTGLTLLRPQFPPLPSTAAMAAFAESRSGIRKIALAQRAAAAEGLRVARADAVFPEFAPGIAASHGSRDDATGFGFSIAGRLALWDRNRAELARATGALAAADRELDSFDRVSLQRSIDTRRQQLLNLEARAAAYRAQVIPAYRAAYDATLSQFRAGQASSLQLFEVQKSLVEAEEKSFDHTVEALTARTQLEQLIGGRLEEVGSVRSSGKGNAFK